MKSYDDLQRFKEKTQTGDIAFKDMSEQTRQADNSQWAIIQQLEGGEQPDPFSGTTASQLQPVGADVFASPLVPPSSTIKPEISSSVKTTSESEGSLLASVAATFPSADTSSADSLVVVDGDDNSTDKGVKRASLLKQTDEQIHADFTGHPVSRYHSLFSMRRESSADSVSKETLLKPLLEKISLCH